MPAKKIKRTNGSPTLLTLFHEYTQARWLMALMAVSLVSGVYYYYFGPANWNSAQCVFHPSSPWVHTCWWAL